MKQTEKWLEWAVELQSLAQAGLYYTQNVFEQERYARIREIAVEMLASQTGFPVDKVRDLFCCEIGYQTPKLDTRSAIFKEDKILLVQERDGKWAMPGGWVDVNLSVKENAIKEAKEEAGLDVTADLIIAVQDRDKHNVPAYAFKICKIFVLCTSLGGKFQLNSETLSSQYFGLDELPDLALGKTNEEQIRLCFDAFHHADTWRTVFE